MAGNNYFGVDFGGTNLRVGEVNPKTGALESDVFSMPMADIRSNHHLASILTSMLPAGSKVGISAAGNVDEKNLLILESPNSPIKGVIDFAKELSMADCDVVLTNDMRAAVQAEARFGQGRRQDNVLVATYSSGYNCAVARNGVNASSAEFGHQTYRPEGMFCGCGGQGHLEPYVSGNGAASMAQQYLLMTRLWDHEIIDEALMDLNAGREEEQRINAPVSPEECPGVICSITSKHVYKAFRKDPNGEPQKTIRETQAQAIAHSFGMMNSAFSPLDVIVCMGSQTKDWDLLFKPAIRRYERGDLQMPSLNKPDILKTNLPEIGVQGAVAYFLSQRK
ncbi:ROK family protein [Candidatus Woesearchaeota archaeon]|nr:ROK family protein [Candidatus Woesearchaeota archaeon]